MNRRCPTPVFVALVFSATVSNAQEGSAPPPVESGPDLDALYEQGQLLFDTFAPEQIKEDYEFPSREQWNASIAALQAALENDDLAGLVKYEEEAKATLATLRAIPGGGDYADWLQERIDYIEAAKQVSVPSAPEIPAATPPVKTEPRIVVPEIASPRAGAAIPHYELWVDRMSGRALPERANELMPLLRAAFEAEGVPGELAWIAEAESTFNPDAKSPAGAKGLFQLMPATAKDLGLSTFLPDERTNAQKSARAAAKLLRRLHDKFGSWPLALAAYNAGEGRVRRLMEKKSASSFAEISSALPSETRMYVPKVCATVAVRSGVTPENLAPPHAG